MNRFFISQSFAGVLALFAFVAQAEAAVDSSELKRGEQPVYGQKYYPGEPMGNPDERAGGMFLELNPLRLLDRGIEAEFEGRISDNSTIGGDLFYSQHDYGSYSQHDYGSGNVTSSSSFWAVAPKVRFYPMEYLSGVFFGFKLYVGQISWRVDSDVSYGGNDIARSGTNLIYAPVAQVGYRVINWGKFTFSAYLGGGVNLGVPNFTATLSDGKRAALEAEASEDNWDSVTKALKDEFDVFRPDFGMTVGILLN